MPRFLTFGEALVVFFPASGRELTRGIGGAELNVALALDSLDASVTYLTRVGDDPFGAAIAHRIAQSGINPLVVVDPDAPTGIYFKETTETAERRVYYYRTGSAASALSPRNLPPLGEFELVHATGITAALSRSCYETVEAASHAARFTFDVNFRRALWSPEQSRAALAPLLAHAELVFTSEDDAIAVTPDFALAQGAPAVVQTRGARGAAYVTQRGVEAETAAAPGPVVDTVGTGDAFAAGFLEAWLRGVEPADCLVAGSGLAAFAISRPGDSP